MVNCKLICWGCCAGLFFLLTCVLGWALWPGKAKPRSPCKVPRETFAHRGLISEGPENSMAAELAAFEKGIGSEADISITKDGVPFLFHDANMSRLTGVNKQVGDVTWAEVKEMTYLKEVNALMVNGTVKPLEYPLKKRGIISLEHWLIEACTKYPKASINFDVKEMRSRANMEKLVKVVAKSPCKNDADMPYIFPSTYPWEAVWLGKALNSHKTLKRAKVSAYIHPGTTKLGAEFWLKTRIWSWWSSHDVLSLHYLLYESHYDIIKTYKDDGYCLAVYGGSSEVMAKWADKVDYMVPDIPSNLRWTDWASVDVQYTAKPLPYVFLILFCLISFVMILVSLWKVKGARESDKVLPLLAAE